MTFNFSIGRLRDALLARGATLTTTVEKGDLGGLIHHFDRLDGEVRLLSPALKKAEQREKVRQAYADRIGVYHNEIEDLRIAEKAALAEIEEGGQWFMPSTTDGFRIEKIRELLHKETTETEISERDSFKVDAALQMGFDCLNDDATIFYGHRDALLAIIRAAEAAGRLAATKEMRK